MRQNLLKSYLIRIVPIFVVAFAVWHFTGLCRVYYSLVAIPLDWFYSNFDPTGFVQRVSTDSNNIVFGLWVNGSVRNVSIHADYLIGNMVVFLALFLATPMKPNFRFYLGYLGLALSVLFVTHVVTVGIGAQVAFMTTPGLQSQSIDGFAARLQFRYMRFYEFIGMYLFVLLLWFPYMVNHAIRRSPLNDARNTPTERPLQELPK